MNATDRERALEAEIARLEKVVRALIRGAERSLSAPDSSYQLFQTNLALEARIRERTGELELALRENERARAQIVEQMAALSRAREQLVRAEKLALAGRIAGGLAHEVNNALTLVLASVDELDETVPRVVAAAQTRSTRSRIGEDASEDVTAIGECVDAIREGAHRLAALVQDFGRIASQGAATPPSVVELREVFARAVRDAAPRLPPIDLGAIGQHATFASAEDVHAALVQVVRFATAPLRVRHSERMEARVEPGLEKVTLVLIDHGLVLSDQELHESFDPRIEVDAQESGSSMRLRADLAIAHGLIARNGGELVLERVADEALAFRISLPTRGT
jgi:two-component system NtrC family sensor kinase